MEYFKPDFAVGLQPLNFPGGPEENDGGPQSSLSLSGGTEENQEFDHDSLSQERYSNAVAIEYEAAEIIYFFVSNATAVSEMLRVCSQHGWNHFMLKENDTPRPSHVAYMVGDGELHVEKNVSPKARRKRRLRQT